MIQYHFVNIIHNRLTSATDDNNAFMNKIFWTGQMQYKHKREQVQSMWFIWCELSV